jgi:hypothetical protein
MKISVSAPQNIYSDAQSVDDENLTLEQNYVNQIHTSMIGNHIGSGVLPEALLQTIIFDSSLSGDLLDGKTIIPQAQPTDSNNGNQLEIELINSKAAGKRTVKMVIIGLDFQNNLQYDTFVFSNNEKQVSTKHYRNVLSLFLNDFIGAPLQSFNLGGKIVIREAAPMTISRDPVMISQAVEPNLIFRDFFVASGGTLSNLLSTALPSYNINALNIKTGYRQLRSIDPNDVSSQIGQKFLSTSNNIQKITLLLAVLDSITPSNSVWTGDLIASIYPLQSTIQSSTDIVPNLAIDFNPNNIPLAQISFNYASLLDTGVKLNTVPQPVDFTFSNTPVGSGVLIKPGSYYVITIKRAGSADTCKIQIATGGNSSAITRETIFNGTIWVDVPEESLWFKVYTDAAKISDGQAYDNGKGIQIPKISIDEITNVAVDNALINQPFLRNEVYSVVVRAATKAFALIQNERTGNKIFSQKEYVPSISLLTPAQLSAIQAVSEPLTLGTITDQNIKSSSVGGSTIGAAIHHYAMVGNEIVMKIIDDPLDTTRYDQNLIILLADLAAGKLNEAKFIPNTSTPNVFYRIVKSELLTLMYGDINGDGVIDSNDLMASTELLNTNLNIFPTKANYLVNTINFVSDTSFAWQLINPSGPTTVASGTDGVLTANGSSANFSSATANFNSHSPLGGLVLTIINSTTSASNNSSFRISALIDNSNITINKIIYTSEEFLRMLRADINSDMIIDSADIAFINNYISLAPPFPATTSPANKIGKTFNAIRLTVDKYIDREDDYPGTSWGGQNASTSPINFSIVKQLNWKEHNIIVNSNPKMVPASFNFTSGYSQQVLDTNLNSTQSFPIRSVFDPGRNDMLIPNNLIIKDGGQLTTIDGSYFKIDFEINTISFEIPAVETFNGQKNVNLLSDFIADYTGTGYTRIGYKSMRFSDKSNVSLQGFSSNQIRISVGVLSLSPQVSGITPETYTGVIVDDAIGVSMDYETGILSLQFSNLTKDAVDKTKNTKIQITIYLKKAGWNNTPIVIDDTKTKNLLGV